MIDAYRIVRNVPIYQSTSIVIDIINICKTKFIFRSVRISSFYIVKYMHYM